MYKKTIAVLLTLFLFQELLYASADDSTLCSGSDLSIISSTSDGSSNTSISDDVGDIASPYLERVKKITFNGEWCAVLHLDGTSGAVFRTSNMKTLYCLFNMPAGETADDIIFGGADKLFCRTKKGLFVGFSIRENKFDPVFVNIHHTLKEDPSKVLLLTDPYDVVNPLSMINPFNGNSSERIVFCRDGLGTTEQKKVVFKEEDESLLVGALRLCRVNASGTRLFCMNVRNGHPIGRALCVDLRRGMVLASYPLIGDYENPEEVLFTNANDLVVLDAPRKNLLISAAAGEQRIPNGLSVDIAHDDALVVANKATVALWKKIGDLYKKAATLSYEAFNSTVRFNPTSDKIVHIAYDENNIGIRCTIFDRQFATIQSLNIRPLGFMSGSGQLHFPRTNPGLLTLIGQSDAVILNVHDF